MQDSRRLRILLLLIIIIIYHQSIIVSRWNTRCRGNCSITGVFLVSHGTNQSTAWHKYPPRYRYPSLWWICPNPGVPRSINIFSVVRNDRHSIIKCCRIIFLLLPPDSIRCVVFCIAVLTYFLLVANLFLFCFYLLSVLEFRDGW